MLESEGWTIEVVLRRGAFQRNGLLTDEAIVDEISGATGSSGQRFKRTISISNRAHLETAKIELAACLSNNPVWRISILNQLDEIRSEHPAAEVDITVFNPSTGVFTLFFAVEREDGILYVPQYSLVVKNDGNPTVMYFGELGADGDVATFRSVLDEFYDGDIGSLLITTTWGCYEQRDTEILEKLGLVYRVFRCDICDQQRKFFGFRNGRWQPIDPIDPFKAFADYVAANSKLIHHIVRKIGPRFGAIVDASSTERPLDALVDEAQAAARNSSFLNPPDDCDLCGCSLDEEKYFVDGKIKGAGAWACMCADCFAEHGQSIEWGSGQLYRRELDGRWLLVAGFGPAEEP